MQELYYANEVAEKLGLKSGRMVSEQVEKHFGKNSMLFDVVGSGGQTKKLYKISRDQLLFVISRSRGDVDGCAKFYGVDINSACLMRNEVLFSNIVKGMLRVVDLSFEQQFKVSIDDKYVLLDMIIYGEFGCCVIEYDEKYHKHQKRSDKKRDFSVIASLKTQMGFDRVEVLRISDNSLSFAESISKIHEMIHCDFFQPITYNFAGSNYA